MLLIVIFDKFLIIEVENLSKSVYVSQIYRRVNFVPTGVDVVMIVRKDTVREIGVFPTIWYTTTKNNSFLSSHINVFHLVLNMPKIRYLSEY